MILHPDFFILGCGTMLRASDSNASDIAALPAENAPWHKKMYTTLIITKTKCFVKTAYAGL